MSEILTPLLLILNLQMFAILACNYFLCLCLGLFMHKELGKGEIIPIMIPASLLPHLFTSISLTVWFVSMPLTILFTFVYILVRRKYQVYSSKEHHWV